MRYGRLVVIGKSSEKGPDGSYKLECVCDCGNRIVVFPQSLRRGATKSCGCLQKEIAKQTCESRSAHNHAKRGKHSKTYRAWRYMRNRVARDHSYSHVTICKEWDSFEQFLLDMGEQPEGRTLDRINNFKPYCKDNCRWSTPKEQSRNKIDTIKVTWVGETLSLSDWAERIGINYSTLWQRIYKLNWPIEKAMTKK